MQEVRKFAGDPTVDKNKKIVFLITHSPFILDLRSEDDLQALISFDLDYSVPTQISKLNMSRASLTSLTQRLNAYHKQLFFSDNPIFVEGIHDSRIVEAMMEARGVSVAGAGSCVIEAGGAENVNHFLRLCQGLGKNAYFLYDLDSLFRGNLRSCIRDDQTIQGFLRSAGLGNDFAQYCGALDQQLTSLIDRILVESNASEVVKLKQFLVGLGKKSQWGKEQWAKARTAVLTAVSRYREDVVSVCKEDVANVDGRLGMIVAALREKNVLLLPGGTLERYLPCYTGDDYDISDEAKQRAVNDEIRELAKSFTESELSDRYGDLHGAVRRLPSKPAADIEPVLRNYLSDYIHELQKIVASNPDWSKGQIQTRLNTVQPSLSRVFSIGVLTRGQGREFNATIEITESLGGGKRLSQVNDQTKAGMGEFDIVPSRTAE